MEGEQEVGTLRAPTARAHVCQGSCPGELVTSEGHWRNSDDSVPRDNCCISSSHSQEQLPVNFTSLLRYLKALSSGVAASRHEKGLHVIPRG